jgi:hypothetical protein
MVSVLYDAPGPSLLIDGPERVRCDVATLG